MASRDSIAIKRQRATERINDSVATLAALLSVEAAPLPTQGRDKALLYANQLDHLANILDSIVERAQRLPVAAHTPIKGGQ